MDTIFVLCAQCLPLSLLSLFRNQKAFDAYWLKEGCGQRIPEKRSINSNRGLLEQEYLQGCYVTLSKLLFLIYY